MGTCEQGRKLETSRQPYLRLVSAECCIQRDGTFVPIFQHHLELELVLNSYNKGHVLPVQFSGQGGLHVPELLLEENLVKIRVVTRTIADGRSDDGC
jgi:hypothetical protein